MLSGTIAAVLFMVGAGATGYQHFHTDAEAAEHVKDFQSYQLQQRTERKIDRVEILEIKKAEIDFQLLSNELSVKQEDFLKNQRSDIQKKIDCLNAGDC